MRCFAALLLLLAITLRAEVTLAPLFQDNAVLQCDKPLLVWGRANPGESIVVSFASAKAATKADDKGEWMVELPAMRASAQPETLTVEGENKIILQNILVGEVWICSGQSNMEWIVSRAGNPEKEIANARHPLIRHIKIERTVAETPQKTVPNGGWKVCSPETVGDFSAVAYYFAREISQKLNIPVGIIGSNWSGSSIESWISGDAYKANPEIARTIEERWKLNLERYPQRMENYKRELAQWEKERDEAARSRQAFNKKKPSATGIAGPGHRDTPSGPYNAMIAPLVPYSIRGIIWYQGEANARRHSEYARLFKIMIQDWRSVFAQGDIPFYWVQLANYRYDGTDHCTWAYLREAQESALTLPNTGQALAIDIGDEKDIHPKNKQEVGRRLALIALAKDYGLDKLNYSGPRYERMRIKDDMVFVELINAKGLHTPDKMPAGAFELAGKDRIFHPAKAQINGETIVLSSDKVQNPIAVRHAWRNFPRPGVNLYNSAKLPLAPFRTDDWPEQ